MKKINISHIIYFTTVSIGAGSFFIANTVVKGASTSAWIPVVLGSVFAALPVFTICATRGQFNEEINITKNRASKKVFKFIYSAILFLACSFLCAHFTSVINMWILPDTSEIFITAGLCIILLITLFKQKRAIFYAVTVSGLFFVTGIVLIRSLIVFGGETVKIFPLFEIERLNGNIIYPALAIFGILSVSSLCTLIFSQKGNTVSWLAGFLLSGCAYFLIIYSCIVLLGAEQTAMCFDAAVLAMRKSDLLGRGDILYFIAWVAFMISAFISAGCGIKAVLSKNDSDRSWLYFICSAGVFFISRVLSNIKNLTDTIIWFLSIGAGGLLYFLAGSYLLRYLKEKNKSA